MNARKAVVEDRIFRQLEEARQRTRWLLGAVSDEDLYTQHVTRAVGLQRSTISPRARLAAPARQPQES